MNNLEGLYNSIIEGAVMRLRPIIMTATAIMAGLLPIMWSHGTGADVIKHSHGPGAKPHTH